MLRIEMDDIETYVYRHVDGEKFDRASIIADLDRVLPEEAADLLDMELLIAEALDAGVLARHLYID